MTPRHRISTWSRLAIVTGVLLSLPPAAVAAGPLRHSLGSSPALATSQPTFGSALRGSAPTGDGPSAVALDPATHTAYVANGNNANGPNAGGNTVSVIDTRRCRAADIRSCSGPWPTVTVGNNPNTLAVDATTHTLYVTNVLDNTVSVVNGQTCNGHVVRGCDQTPVTVPVGGSPTGIFVDARTDSVYVGNFDDATVSVFSSAACNGTHHTGCPSSPPATFTVGDGPGDIDVNQRTHTAYVTTLTGLTAFDTRTCNATSQKGCTTTGTFTICTDCFGPFSAKVEPLTNTIYEGDGDTSIAAIDGSSCNADNLAGCATAPFGVVKLPPAGFEHILWTAVDPRRHTVYALAQKDDTAVLIDTRICNGTHVEACSTMVLSSVHTGPDPEGLFLNHRTHTLYVANQVGDSLSVIDTSTCNAEATEGCRHRPPNVVVPGAADVAVDTRRGTAYVTADSGAVAMIDTHHCNARHPGRCDPTPATVQVGGSPAAVVVDRSARTVYVASAVDKTHGSVAVLSTRACDAHPSGCTVRATVPITRGTPTSIAVNPKTHAVYVGASTPDDASTITVFDGSACDASTTSGCGDKTGVMSFGPPRGPSPDCGVWFVGVVVNATTDTVYATDTEGCGGRGEKVFVFDGSTCGAAGHSGCGLPLADVAAGLNPIGLAVDPLTDTVYAALLANGEHASSVAVIDGARCNASNTSGCPRAPALAPTVFGSVGVTIDPVRHLVYVTNVEDTSVSFVDTRKCNGTDASGCAHASTPVPTDDYPGGVAVDPHVGTVYVTSGLQGTVSMIRSRQPGNQSELTRDARLPRRCVGASR